MSLRFRKSIKIAPGIRLNLSKSGVSTSIGKPGATINISKRGARVTTGIPGTGLSASKLYKPKSQRKASLARQTPANRWSTVFLVVAVAFVFLAFISSGSSRATFFVLGLIFFVGFIVLPRQSRNLNETDVPYPATSITNPQPRVTAKWKDREATIKNAGTKLQKPFSLLNNKNVSDGITTKNTVITPHLQATVNGSPTYHYSDRKNDLSAMVACAEAEIDNYWKQPSDHRLCAAPFYFERAAILYRKAKLYADEVQICEAWIAIIEDYSNQNDDQAAQVHLGPRSKGIINRLHKARELLKKQQGL